MTVKELKEKLEQFPDDLKIFVPNITYVILEDAPDIVLAQSVYRGVNEYDGCLIIDSCMDED